MKFKVGDIIVVIKEYNSSIGIQFEDFNEGHSIRNRLPRGSINGFCLHEKNIDIYKNNINILEIDNLIKDFDNI